MDGSAADERELPVDLDGGGPEELASPPIPDELLLDIFRRIHSPADLVRASAACVSFRRLISNRSFLRQYRKLHSPPLLGFLDRGKVFYPTTRPYPSASAASAAALAGDFSFSFLPAPASDWFVRDIRDGRVVLDRWKSSAVCHHRFCDHRTYAFPELVVCDPLHRRYLILPPLTYDLAAAVEETDYCSDIFLVSPGDGDEAVAAEEPFFRVVWMAQCETRLVAFVFSSNTGQWRAIPSKRWSHLFAGLPPLGETSLFYSRHYVYGCFYWMIEYGEEIKLLVLDTQTMEFSTSEPPEEANISCDWVMVEAGEGRLGMFVLPHDESDLSIDLSYFIMKNDGGSSIQWQKVKTISVGSETFLICNMEKYLLLYQPQSSLLEAGCFTLDTETFQLEKVCAIGSNIYKLHAYGNFPPSLLSSPTVSSGFREDAEKPMLEQDTEVLPAEAHSHHDQNTSAASAGGQASHRDQNTSAASAGGQAGVSRIVNQLKRTVTMIRIPPRFTLSSCWRVRDTDTTT